MEIIASSANASVEVALPQSNHDAILCWSGINLDGGRLKATEERLKKQNRQVDVLSSTASRLLAAGDPLVAIKDICFEVMRHLECHIFFNFVLEHNTGRLRLNAWTGISDDEARTVEWLDLGVAVSGCVPRDMCQIVTDGVQQSNDPRAEFVKSRGILAYYCRPLLAEGRVIGSLSFGTTTRSAFDVDDIKFIDAVGDLVAAAVHRLLLTKEAERQKRQFLAVLSHELRNPLTPIRNGLYIIERAAPGTAQAARAGQIMVRQVNQLVRLVDDLLDITRFTHGKLRIERRQIDLFELVMLAVEDYRGTFEKLGVHFECQLNLAGPLWIYGDAARLTQAIGNLFANAAKFTPPGGRVTLRLDKHGDNPATLCIKDTGVGIPTALLESLFEPFVQADNSLDRRDGGLGLGLSLVREIVKMHDGTVEAYSDGLGMGAEFVVYLPVETATPLQQPFPSVGGPLHRALRRQQS